MGYRVYKVEFTKFAAKQIERLPREISEAVYLWRFGVEESGLPEIRKLKGYHDEPLKGTRKGQRSVRLNRSYRLIYEEHVKGEIVLVGILEVNNHEY